MSDRQHPNHWRPDIQGLRALAVIAVILNHLGVPVRAGFLGVDIFIVVSGFVITGLLLREIEASGKIQLLRFFKWRFMRLFPAHVVMLSSTFLLFLFIGPFGAHKAALNQARASIGFVANAYFFARPKDYFALGDDLTLFLNTWSLALEEQFYVIFAVTIFVLIFVITKIKNHSEKNLENSILYLILFMMFVSLLVALITSLVWKSNDSEFKTGIIGPSQWLKFMQSRGQEFAFYSPITRAWQFLLGALLALTSKKRTVMPGTLFSNFSLGSILAILMFAEADSLNFFSWSRITITLLTFSILSSRSSLLSGNWLVAIGDRSYSLYLWHYPLIVISRSIDSIWASTVAILGTLIMSELSFRYVEMPFRHSKNDSIKSRQPLHYIAPAIVLLSFVSLGLRLDVFARNLIDSKYLQQGSIELDHFYEEKGMCWSDSGIVTCDRDLSGTVLLIGDSHAESLRPGFFKAVLDLGLIPQIRPSGKCFFQYFDTANEDRDKSECGELGLELQKEIISQRPRLLVLLACGRLYNSCPEGLESDNELDWVNAGELALRPILDAGIPVAFVRDLPVLSPDPRTQMSVARSIFSMPINRFRIDEDYKRMSKSHFDLLFKRLNNSSADVHEVNFLQTICQSEYCVARSNDGQNLWMDADHLSVAGSLEVADSIGIELSRIIKIK